MIDLDRRGRAQLYTGVVVSAAIVVVLTAAAQLSPSRLGLPFLLLATAGVLVGPRVHFRIPRFRAEIPVSFVFVFVAILQFDGEAAICLAAVAGLFSPLRIPRAIQTRIIKAGAGVCSTALTVFLIRAWYGSLTDLSHGDITPAMVGGIFWMGLCAYAEYSTIVAMGAALSSGAPFARIWRRRHLPTLIPFLAASCSALVASRLSNGLGLYGLLVAVPIVGSLWLAYATHVTNMKVSTAQAEQARRHLAELRQSEERFRSSFDNAAIGMALVSAEGRWLKVNRALCKLLGYREEELLGIDMGGQIHTDDLDAVRSRSERIIGGTPAVYPMEKRFLHKQGHEVWTLLSIARINDPMTGFDQLSFQVQDITDRKNAEMQLQHDAFHDPLTGLPNRALFMDHLQLALNRHKRAPGRSFAVLALSLDRFNTVNDSYGHSVGDQLLVSTAHRLEEIMRPGDTVARCETNEFAVLVEDITGVRDAMLIADRISGTLTNPIDLNGMEVVTTITIGIAPGAAGYENPEDILRDADAALSRAKGLGRARYEVFNHAMHAGAMNVLILETDLRKAIERGEFVLHYQPILSLRSGAIEGFEALVRWRHPERGLIYPMGFIPLAEESDLIHDLGTWVLREACRQTRIWNDGFPGLAPLTMSVNLSGRRWAQPDLVDQTLATLAETGCPRHLLKLEITESILMDNVEAATAALVRLKDLGIDASIDDFGTGYSSLSYLHRLPAATLKIDRSFVSSMNQKHESLEIVRTIVMLARNLYMSVIAEGIETTDQLEQLRILRCEQGQGYLFAPALDPDAAADLLRTAEGFPLLSDPSDVPVVMPHHD